MAKDMPEEKTELEKDLVEKAAQEPSSQEPPAGEVTDGGEPLSETPDSGEAPESTPETVDETVRLAAELAVCAAERDGFKDQLLRARAEFDNYRKRIARESEQARLAAAQGLIRDLLPVADNLDRALEHAGAEDDGLAGGVRMILRQFQDILAARGLSPIPALGEAFDPNIHEGLAILPSEEHAMGMVMSEFERGYTLGGMVLRPAKVVVSSGPPVEASAPAGDGDAEQAAEPENNKQ